MVCVGHGERETARKWKEENSFPYSVLLDPGLELYRDLGMKRSAMIGQAFNFWSFAEDYLAGRQIPTIIEGENMDVMGGDFITDSSGKLVLSHKMEDGHVRDRPSLKQALATLDAC